MSEIEYLFVVTLLLIVFLCSILKMRVALDQEDIYSFSVWVFVASLLAGLPFMVMTLTIVS